MTCGLSAEIGTELLRRFTRTKAVQIVRVVPIHWTKCHFGGQRPWFNCPCGRRVAKLYWTEACFACRRCLGLLTYAPVMVPKTWR
jgi:hypothetical protein